MDLSVEVGPTRIEVEETITEVRFRGFADLPAEVGDCKESPVFTCCGNRWSVVIYPGGDGDEDSDDVVTAIYLTNRSNDRVKARYEFILRGPDGAAVEFFQSGLEDEFGPYSEEEESVGKDELGPYWGTSDFGKHSEVMESLVEGAMVVDVKICHTASKSPFVPENPHLKNSVKLFMDEETADVIFKVGTRSKKKKGKRKRGEESTCDFHAHRLVLKHNAPVLAEFCGPGEGGGELPSAVPIEDIDADIFHHLLFYVYGGEIKGEDLDARAKDIIDAANRYGVVVLKLLAEARYVELTKLNVENMMEHLLFADAKNCALMKEAVVDFVLANGVEVLENVSFDDCPGGLVRDILAAVTQSKKKGENGNGNPEDQLVTMRVSELRRRLHEKGLDVDGSREAMIAALRESS